MILVTGCAGFIGFHLTKQLLAEQNEVIGIDNINDYYDPSLKNSRLNVLVKNKNFKFHQIDICDISALTRIFDSNHIDIICHLAAQAGVRYSLTHPFVYQKSKTEETKNAL